MDGFEVLPMERAAEIGDIFCTATGDKHVISPRHIERMKDGAILVQHGPLQRRDRHRRRSRSSPRPSAQARTNVEEYGWPTAARIYLIAEGRLVNLAAAEGHPAAVMDMSFANQALVGRVHRRRTPTSSSSASTTSPRRSTSEIARLKLETMGVEIDRLTEEQAQVPGLLGRGDLVRSSRRRSSGSRSDRSVMLDQRRLPDEEVELVCRSAADVAEAIRTLAVRGAPAIGIAAAYGYALAAERGEDLDAGGRRRSLASPAHGGQSRLGARRARRGRPDDPAERAREIHAEEVERCRAMGEHARGALRARRPAAHALQHGRRSRRAATARRSARSGAPSARAGRARARRTRRGRCSRARRLTAWELERARRSRTRSIADSARRRRCMARGEVTHVVVGADRIARERRHGEQDRHVLARRRWPRHHGIPFAVVAPTSTIDLADAHRRRESRSRSATRSARSPTGSRPEPGLRRRRRPS